MRKCICSFFILFIFQMAFSVTVSIASINEVTDTTTQSSPTFTRDIIKAIKNAWVGDAVTFTSVSLFDTMDVNTIVDAARISSIIDSEYLLYGYVKKNATSWFTELKLYNTVTQKNEKLFFASDDIDSYERLIFTIANNIVDWFSVLYGVEVVIEEPTEQYYAIDIPIRLGYWTYMNSEWASLLIGTFDFDAGAEFNPGFILPKWFSKNFDITFGLSLGYRLGVGNPNAYEAYFHGISVTTPVLLHCELTEVHNVFFGLGLLYEADIVSLYEKYKEQEIYATHLIGTTISAGYRWDISEKIIINTGLDIDIYFSPNTAPVFRTKFGVVIPIWEKREILP